jgi:hypothetical protein
MRVFSSGARFAVTALDAESQAIAHAANRLDAFGADLGVQVTPSCSSTTVSQRSATCPVLFR